jgi:hypothetical protein
MNRPVGIKETTDQPLLNGDVSDPAPIGSNWRIEPANDNNPPMEGFAQETRVEIMPSMEAIERSMVDVQFVYHYDPQILKDGKFKKKRKGREQHAWPVSGDFEIANGGIVRIGRLQFSDGSQTERCHMSGIDGKVIEGNVTLPRGAMLNTKDKSTRPTGPTVQHVGTNGFFAKALMGEDASFQYLPCRRKKKRGEPITKEEAKAELAKAIANTPNMPDVKRLPDGLPRGTQILADLFLGMRKTTCAGGGSMAWQDMHSKMIEREGWMEAMASMTRKDIDVLEAATTAENMADIGASAGFSGEYSRKAGKRVLIAANDNMASSLKRTA